MERKIEWRQIKPDLEITHQGQCAHQVSLNLADPDFPGLTRFLSQGLLIITHSRRGQRVWQSSYDLFPSNSFSSHQQLPSQQIFTGEQSTISH